MQTSEMEQRQQNLVRDYQDGKSVVELSKMYGVSDRWVYMILKSAGVEVKRQKRRALSPIHRHIGQVLAEAQFDRGLTKAALATRLGWSFQKTTNTLQGTMDLTILDLQDLSTFLKMPYNDLMTSKTRSAP